jgi:Uma2 family endonuclease
MPASRRFLSYPLRRVDAMTTRTDTLSPMTSTPVKAHPSSVTYPDSDGKPMSDNTLQWDTISYVVNSLRSWYHHRPDVFVAGDLLWYYQEGNPKARIAPDGLVAFGRPRGYRGSYKQWEEDGICPQVVFEVLSPKNTRSEMREKYNTYARLGCQEYYEINPYRKRIIGFEVLDSAVTHISDGIGRHSARLGLKLQFDDQIFRFVDPSGTYLPTSIEAVESTRASSLALARAVSAGDRATAAAQTALAQNQTVLAEKRAAEARADKLANRLRALGIDPDE